MTLSEITQRVDGQEAASSAIRNAFSLTEQVANDLARMLRGMTTATPERRKLREDVERAVEEFIRATASPDAALSYTQPETSLSLILSQSPAANTPLSPGDEEKEAA